MRKNTVSVSGSCVKPSSEGGKQPDKFENYIPYEVVASALKKTREGKGMERVW